MANPPNRSAERQSWKKRASVEHQRSTKSRRWMMTLLAIGLLVLFGWLLYQGPSLRVQFVALEVKDYAKRVVPQLPSDMNGLAASSDEDVSRALQFLTFTDLSEALDEPLGGLSRIENICSKNDRLIVYLCAHLVPTSDNKIDILLRNYDVTTPTSDGSPGRYSLEDLLQRMAASAAGVKLLLIDSGRLTIDPRLSLLGNRAYALLQQQVDAIGDKSLGVVVSTQPFESACGWYGRPQSFFGQAVVEAFQGLADSNDNSWLTVDEVYQHVARQCYYHSGKTQTPVLLALNGNVERLAAQRLFALEKTESTVEDETASDEVETEATSDAGAEDPATKSTDQPDDTAASSADVEESGETGSADSGNDVAADNDNSENDSGGQTDEKATEDRDASQEDEPYLRLIDRAWRQRDRLIAKHPALAAVPHLCRELDARILDYELRYHGRPPSHLTFIELEDLIDTLESLVRQARAQTNHKLGQRFSAGLRSFSPTEHPSILSVQRCSYWARDFVDWHGKVAYLLADGESDEFARSLQPLLVDIASFRDSLPNKNATVMLSETQEKKLRKSSREIEAHERIVRKKWMELLQNAMRNAENHRDQCLIEATLGTRLPDAKLRAELRQSLFESRQWTPVADIRLPATGASTIRENLIRHARLEKRLLPSDILADARFDDWSGLRKAAVAIGEYYAGLAEQINSRQLDSNAWDLAAVDYRDASDVYLTSTGQFPATYLKRPEFTLVDPPAPAITLSPDGHDLSWRFINTTGADVTAEINYDPNLVVVYGGSDANPIRIAPNTTIPAGGAQSASYLAIQWQVHPKVPKREKPITAELTCRFAAGDEMIVKRIVVTQVVNTVDLLAYHVTAGNTLLEHPESLVVLKPFPNRPSQIRLALRNRSNRQKTVSARLALIPRSAVTPGRLADESFEVLPDIQRRVTEGGRLADWAEIVAETIAPITLPADGAEPLVLAAPGTAPPNTASEGGAAAAQPPAAQPSEKDVSYGLVCEISEAAGESSQPTRWLKWLEIRPLEPNDYLTCRAAYDAVTEEFTATIRSRGPLFPRQPRLDGKLISIRWDTSPFVKRPQRLIGRGNLKDPNDSLTIRGQFERPASIWLDVDDYPRAFVYEIRASGRRDEGPTATAVRIVSLAHPDFPKVYVRRGTIDDLRPTLAEGQRYVEFGSGGQVAFPQLDTAVTMRFQVDALPSAFGPDDLGQDNRDVVQINLGDDLATFYDDRQVRTTLTNIEQDTIDLNCQVSDYAFPIGAIDMSAPERLQVEARIDGTLRATDDVQFIFDQTEPEFDVTVPRTAEAGQNIPIRVIAKNEESGIDRIAVGYVDRKEDPLDKPLTREETSTASFSLKAPQEDREYLVKIVVTNGALLSSERVFRVRVDPKPEKVEPPPPPPKYTVQGIVQIGSRYKRGIEVTLKGKSVVTKDDGKFSFSDVDGGDAKLTATARIPGQTKTYVLEKDISLPLTGPDNVIDIGVGVLRPQKK